MKVKVKMKPKKAMKAKYKVTGTGKLKRRKPGKRHILTKKSSNRKRRLGKSALVDKTVTKKIARLIGA